jgi:hypothetical protein
MRMIIVKVSYLCLDVTQPVARYPSNPFSIGRDKGHKDSSNTKDTKRANNGGGRAVKVLGYKESRSEAL